MHKIINKKSIQKITAVIIIMIMCNFIMSGKAFAGYGAATQDPGASTGNAASTGQNTGTIEDAIDVGVKSDEIKAKIKSQLDVSDDTATKIYTDCYNDVNKIKISYTHVSTTGITTLNSVDTSNITQKDIAAMMDGSYVSNMGSQTATAGGNAPGTDGETASSGSYRDSELEGNSSLADTAFGILAKPIVALVLGIGDGVNQILQICLIGDKSDVFEEKGLGLGANKSMIQITTDNTTVSGVEDVNIVKDYLDVINGGYGLPNIKLTPAEIFAGNVSALDANFFKTTTDHSKELGGSDKSIVEELKDTVATWYVALRNIAIVGLLSALLYIGIRIVISSSAGDKAKYKQFFVDWVVALCLIFFMHYIMAFTMTMSETVTDVLTGSNDNQGRIKEVNIYLTGTDGTSQYYEGGTTAIKFSSNFTGLARIKATYKGVSLKIGYSVLYIALTAYTVYFAFVYLKRLLMLAFFTMIAPLVALTYPLDKIKDGKAQAFNYWFKEYMFYALLQPLHMLLYKVFVSSALSVAADNLLYAIVAIAFIVPAEKIVKQMFGIKGNTEDKLGGFAGGALASQAFNMLKKGPPQPKKGGDAPKGEKGIRLNNPNKPNAMDTLAGDAMENGVENAAQTATAAGIGAAAGAASAQATENEGSEENSNSGAEAQRGTPIEDMDLDQIAAMQEKYGKLEAGQVAPESTQQQDNGIDNEDQNKNEFKAVRDGKWQNLKTAANVRFQEAGGIKGIGLGALKTGAKVASRGGAMLGMGMLGLGLGAVSGDMGDTIKGMAAGMTAGYAVGGRLSSAVGNIAGNAGNTALGSFIGDTVYGFGPERQRNDYIKSYMSSQENRNRLIEKNPHISGKELNAQLRQRAELSYDSGVTDAKKLDRAVKLKAQLDAKNPRGAGTAENHGANYDKTVATMQLAEKYSDSTFEDDEKIAKAQNRLANKLERNMNNRTNGPIDADTAREYKARANAEAAETMNNIDYLKNG